MPDKVIQGIRAGLEARKRRLEEEKTTAVTKKEVEEKKAEIITVKEHEKQLEEERLTYREWHERAEANAKEKIKKWKEETGWGESASIKLPEDVAEQIATETGLDIREIYTIGFSPEVA